MGLLLLVVLLGKGFLVHMGLWLIGVAAAFFPWRAPEKSLLAGLAFLGVLVATRLFQATIGEMAWGIWFRDYAVALSFAWWLVSMRCTRFEMLGRAGAMNRFMADFSYSLYLIHFPLMLFLLGALHATGLFEPIARGYSPTSPEGLGVQALVIAMTYGLAWLFAGMTERRTPIVRAKLKQLLERRALSSSRLS